LALFSCRKSEKHINIIIFNFCQNYVVKNQFEKVQEKENTDWRIQVPFFTIWLVSNGS